MQFRHSGLDGMGHRNREACVSWVIDHGRLEVGLHPTGPVVNAKVLRANL